MTSVAANTERLRKSSLARRGLPSLDCIRLAAASASYCQDASRAALGMNSTQQASQPN